MTVPELVTLAPGGMVLSEIDVSGLPLVNASLNATALVLLLCGYAMIKKGRRRTHKRFMVSAFFVSVLFLISYVTYHLAGTEKRFGGTGWIRPVYFIILVSHVALAATVPILATRTLYLGLRERWVKHRWWAKITFPIWVYVSVTGVIVYLLLYRLYGPAVGAVG